VHLGAGRYAEATGPLQRIYHTDPPRHGTALLPDMVEAGLRGDDPLLAKQALGRLGERAAASGTAWGRGVLGRSLALASDDDEAEALYLEAIELLGTTRVKTDLARAHLLYGEWLRRQKRRADARLQLRTAFKLF